MMENNTRRKIKTLEVMVADVIDETYDTSTLVLFTGNDRLEYQPGHFLTIDPHQFEAIERWITYLEDLKEKKEPPRAYSIASSPDEHYLAITVKEERYTTGVTKFPPLLSPILAKRTRQGRKMIITGFTGPYTLPKDGTSPGEILHICAGSGIVPNWSLLKYTLRNYPDSKHTLIYSNKTWAETIYGRSLIKLQKDFANQLKIIFTVTREDPPDIPADIRMGRINLTLISESLNDMNDPLVYVCGPGNSMYEKKEAKMKGTTLKPRFLETTLNILDRLGIDKKRIKRESYG